MTRESTVGLVSASLFAGLFTYDDTGTYRINGCSGNDPRSTCVKQGDQAAAHGIVDLRRALTVSSDTYFYRVGDLLWGSSGNKEMVQDVARELGFGSRTGIELPDEQPGFVGTPELLKRLHDQYPKAYPYGDQWYSGNDANLAIGQDVVNATPIQLANAYATFGNGGTRYRPTLLLKVTKFRSNQVLYTQKPDVVGHLDIPPDWRQTMLTGLEGVTADSDGTAQGAFSAVGYPTSSLAVAGKTGTSQNNVDPQTGQALQDNSLFVGFAPADAPRYAAAAVFEQAGYGAAVAAPAIIDFFLPLGRYGQFPEVQPTTTPLGNGSAAQGPITGSNVAGNATSSSTIAPLEGTGPSTTSTTVSPAGAATSTGQGG